MKEVHPVLLALALGAPLVAQYDARLLDRSIMPRAASLVFDAANRRVIALDGDHRMWDWDGTVFRERLGANQFGAWSHPAFDPTHQLLYVGNASQLRSWDGVRWSSSPAPSAITVPLAFDEARQTLVCVQNSAVVEFRSGTWTTIPATTLSSLVDVVYDSTLGRCVALEHYPAALRGWTGTAWNVLPGAMPQRTWTGLASDPRNHRLVVCGLNGSAPETWQYASGRWTPIPTPSDLQVLRASLVFDGIGILCVNGDASYTGDVWRLHGASWRRLAHNLGVADLRGVASSPTRGDILLFGGRGGIPVAAIAETWTFDGAWHRASPPASPPARSTPGLAWSSYNQAYVLYGGTDAVGNPLGDTWSWNGATWSQLAPPTQPPLRGAPLLVPDPSGTVVLLPSPTTPGPNTQWLWAGTDWVAQPSLAFASVQTLDAAHDPLRNRVVLATRTELYEWDGGSWSAAVPLPSWSGTYTDPVFRPATGRMLFTQGPLSFEWDGIQFTPLVLETNSITQLATDFGRGRVLAPYAVVDGRRTNLAVFTSTPAAVAHLGTSCAIGDAPGLTTLGLPIPGDPTFAIEAQALPARAPCALALGLATGTVPIGGGCTLSVNPTTGVVFTLTSTSGRVSRRFPIPNTGALRGVEFAAQLAVVDPAHGRLGPVALSDALLLTIGD